LAKVKGNNREGTMRPCRQCRAPAENNVATCPQCGADQAGWSEKQPHSSTPPRHSITRQLLRDILDLGWVAPPLLVIALALPLVAVGGVGYLLAGEVGAGIGVGLLVIFLTGAALWAESGG
jgi:hypothetical protein